MHDNLIAGVERYLQSANICILTTPRCHVKMLVISFKFLSDFKQNGAMKMLIFEIYESTLPHNHCEKDSLGDILNILGGG